MSDYSQDVVNIAIISVSNQLELSRQMKTSAIKTLGNLTCSFHIIDNNGNGRFSSAASAYNSFLDQSIEAEVYVFCHQDIIFLHEALQTMYRLCMEDPMVLYGAAGVKNDGNKDVSRVISSMAMIQEGWNYKTLRKDTTESVFTLDECLICGSGQLFNNLRFDEKVCDGWHLYVAELCMQCHVKKIPVKVFDADIVHLSGGTQDKSFFICEKRIVKKYRGIFPVISYTCGWAYTGPLKYWLLSIYRKIRYGI